MSFSDNIKVMTINYGNIKDCDILSFEELPAEQTKVLRELPENEEALVQRFQKIIQLALIDPSRWAEFEELSIDDFFTFFWKWMQASELIKEDEAGTV